MRTVGFSVAQSVSPGAVFRLGVKGVLKSVIVMKSASDGATNFTLARGLGVGNAYLPAGAASTIYQDLVVAGAIGDSTTYPVAPVAFYDLNEPVEPEGDWNFVAGSALIACLIVEIK